MIDLSYYVGKYVVVWMMGSQFAYIGYAEKLSPEKEIVLVRAMKTPGPIEEGEMLNTWAEAGPDTGDTFVCIDRQIVKNDEILDIRDIEADNIPLFDKNCH